MTKPPRNPTLVLLAAVLLPGSGHVAMGLAQRGLTFLFFMIVLGWAGNRVMPETVGYFTRHVGGIFIYGVSVIDAYKTARIKWETWKYAEKNINP